MRPASRLPVDHQQRQVILRLASQVRALPGARELLKYLSDAGVPWAIATSGRIATASKHELISTLHEFLLSLMPIHGSAVLIIDEAQHLSTQVLEQIRIISNLETNESKLLQIVLVGQLNLLDILAAAEMRQLDQRISIRATLKALNREEVEAYIAHRLWVARGSRIAIRFRPLPPVSA